MRAAYALDDEISWGSFVKPRMWKASDDDAAYKKWLEEVYGAGKAPKYSGWIGYNDIRPKLAGWTLGTFDASQLMDQWTFNDSYWANFLGDLVEYANTVDPEMPCGFVGGQAPNASAGAGGGFVGKEMECGWARHEDSAEAACHCLRHEPDGCRRMEQDR